jgi:hypothetical protein
VVGADLKADFLVALGHRRIVETSRQDALVPQMGGQRRCARSIARRQRNNRMFAGHLAQRRYQNIGGYENKLIKIGGRSRAMAATSPSRGPMSPSRYKCFRDIAADRATVAAATTCASTRRSIVMRPATGLAAAHGGANLEASA